MAVWSVVNKSDLQREGRIDAEYYQPYFLDIAKKIRSHKSVLSIGRISDSVVNGVEIRTYCEKGIPYLRVGDIRSLFIDVDNAVHIDQKLASQVTKDVELQQGDLLIARSGSIGQFTITTPDLEGTVISSHLMRVRLKKEFNPYYVVAFLNSKFGVAQLLRRNNGAVVPEINQPALRTIEIVLLDKKIQKDIENNIRLAYSKKQEVKKLYAEAESLLLKELGINNLDLSHRLSYTTTISAIRDANRFDAEYFQPKYLNVLKAVKKSGFRVEQLSRLIYPIKNGFDYRGYSEDGHPYIRVGDIKKDVVDWENAARVNISPDEMTKDVRLKADDVLFTRKGTYGHAGVVTAESKDAIISSEIMLLRLRKDSGVLPRYLSLLLNSDLGYYQVDRESHGAQNYSITQEALGRLKIIIPPEKIQHKIVIKVEESLQARSDAKKLLSNAKQRIEELIEKGKTS